MTLRSYTRIKPVSEKRKARQPLRDACRDAVLKRAGRRCEVKLDDICTREATDVHEILTRAQGGDETDPANCLASCRACHMHLHNHPAEANALGLIYSKKYEAQRHG